MKKRILAVLLCALVTGSSLTGFKSAGDDQELVLFTWEGMFPQEVLDEYADPHTEKYEQMVQDICKMQNFTSLRYHRLDDLLESIGIDPDNICTYCFNGKDYKRKRIKIHK